MCPLTTLTLNPCVTDDDADVDTADDDDDDCVCCWCMVDSATLPLLRLVAATLKSVPLIGALPQYAMSILSYLNKMHFYNSNS